MEELCSGAASAPEVGTSRESKNSGRPRFPAGTAQLPKPVVPGAAHPPSLGRERARPCRRCRRRPDPASRRRDTASTDDWPAQPARSGREAGSRGGWASAGEGTGRPRPRRGYTERRPRAQPAFCRAATRVLLSARTSETAVAPPAFPICWPPTRSSC